MMKRERVSPTYNLTTEIYNDRSLATRDNQLDIGEDGDMKREYKISKRNSTVCGYPGRDFDWGKFYWDGLAVHKSIFKGQKDLKAPTPFVDDCLIAPDCQYLHVPYDFEKHGTIYRVRPNPTMYAGEIYRGHLIKKQTAKKKDDGWYWVLESDIELGVG